MQASRGYILVPVAIAIALIAVIAYLSSRETALENRLVENQTTTSQADYVAEAGLQHALRHLAQQGCGPYTDLDPVGFAGGTYRASLSGGPVGVATYTVDVDRDGWIDQTKPNQANNNDTNLKVSFDGGVESRAVFQYDLSAFAPGSSVLSATAWFYVDGAFPEGPVDLYRLGVEWEENKADWLSLHENYSEMIEASLPPQSAGGQWVSLNLTAQVQAWINGQSNHGFMLKTDVSGVDATILSRESSNAPYLQLIMAAQPINPSDLTVKVSYAEGQGVELNRASVALRQRPVSFIEQRLHPGSGRDVLLDSGSSNRNYGDHELGLSSAAGDNRHSLIYFDLPTLPPGVDIVSARLELYHSDTTSATGSPEAVAYRVTQDWTEGTQAGAGAADGATWDTRNGGDNWLVAGGDSDTRVVASSSISPASGDWESWEVKSLVEGWLDGRYPNYGILLRPDGDLNVAFASREDGDASRHPRLSIDYTCRCGQVCQAPQAQGRVMFIVDDVVDMGPADLAKIALLERWGFQVNPIRDSDSAENFVTLATDSDVIFVSESVSLPAIAPKIGNTPIGIVLQNGFFNPDFGIGAGQSWTLSTEAEVTDGSHFITAPFAPGALSFAKAPMEQLTLSGTQAPDLQTLVEVGGSPALAVLDSGATLYGGGTTAGRRVMLPMGRGEAYNWSMLNSNAGLILQRALTWAARLDVISETLLMVVIDPSSLTAQEQARREMIESWGYAVTLIGQAETQAVFDAAFALNSVVFVSEQIDPLVLGNKLINAPIGVVSESAGLADDFAFAQSQLFPSINQIEIVDNSHYITEEFAIGALQLTSSAQSVYLLNGEQAPGLWILGQGLDGALGLRPSLSILEAGAQLWGGGLAAGRRVSLPWGAGGFDFDALNEDGQLLMRRALEWAASTSGGETAVAHWKLDEDKGNTAFDSLGGFHGDLDKKPWWYPGILGGALDLEGSDQRVDVTDAAPLDFLMQGGATVSGWFHARGWGGGGSGRILDKTDATAATAGWQVSLDSASGALEFEVAFSSSNGLWRTPPGSITLGTWHQFTIVYNSTSALNNPTIYIDGEPLIVNEIISPSGNAEADFGIDLALGNHAQSDAFGFDGRLDDIRLFDRMLSAAQVAELAEAPGPIAHWLFDEGGGDIAHDYEGGNDGKLEKDPVWVEGVFSDALFFDGQDQYVKSTKFDVTGSGLSIMGWIRPESLDEPDMQIISKAKGEDAKDTWWQLGLVESAGQHFLTMRVRAGNKTEELTDTTAPVDAGQWYFAAATYDSISGQMRLYLDGAEVASAPHTNGGIVSTDDREEVAVAANADKKHFFHGIVDDARVYDYALSPARIQALFDEADVPSNSGYLERYVLFQAPDDEEWGVVSLADYGVPGNAVVEIAMVNKKDKEEYEGGLRSVGSPLERRFLLTEAENKGYDTLTLHVQTDAASQIEVYSEKKKELQFMLLGYWVGASYVELYAPFSAGTSGAWVPRDMTALGLAPYQVAEVVMANRNEGARLSAGIRESGSGAERRFDLRDAEDGGENLLSVMVNTNAAGSVDAYAEFDTDIGFHVVGYWSSAPGTYTEAAGIVGTVNTPGIWRSRDLSSLGVPAEVVAQFVLANESVNENNEMGIRESNSGSERIIELEEAETGGADHASMHVVVDADNRIEWYSQAGPNDNAFYPAGWWNL